MYEKEEMLAWQPGPLQPRSTRVAGVLWHDLGSELTGGRKRGPGATTMQCNLALARKAVC